MPLHDLCDICSVDHPDRAERFEVVYHLLSMTLNQRIRVKVATDEEQPVPSRSGFIAARVVEREAWDLFGFISATTPICVASYRLRLEGTAAQGFPADGYVELRYDEDQKVVYEPVRLKQEFRSFDFLSPWEAWTRSCRAMRRQARPTWETPKGAP